MRIVRMLVASVGLAAVPAAHSQSAADAGRPLRIVVPFPAGTPLDVVARLVGPKLSDALHRPVFVDDKPGAAGVIGTREVARTAASKDVLLFTVHSSVVVNPYLYANLGYEPKELAPVALIGMGSYLLVSSKSSGLKSMADLVDAAKAKPESIRYGSYGIGSGPHLCMELLKKTVSISLTHIPYKAAPLNDLVSNNIELSMEPVAAALPFVEDGRLNAIGYTTSLKTGRPKSPIPSILEGHSGFECGNWVGMFAQAAAGPEFANQVHAEVEKILQQPEVQQRIKDFGIEPTLMTRSDFGNFVDKEYTRWGTIVRDAGVKME